MNTKIPYSRTLQTGFTLIELLLVLGILAVLVSVAVPSYQGYMQESRRTDGQLLLRHNALVLERCLTFFGSYTDCDLISNSEDDYYQLSDSRTARTYTLQAIPGTKGHQNTDSKCQALTLNHSGEKSATGSNPEVCW